MEVVALAQVHYAGQRRQQKIRGVVEGDMIQDEIGSLHDAK